MAVTASYVNYLLLGKEVDECWNGNVRIRLCFGTDAELSILLTSPGVDVPFICESKGGDRSSRYFGHFDIFEKF